MAKKPVQNDPAKQAEKLLKSKDATHLVEGLKLFREHKVFQLIAEGLSLIYSKNEKVAAEAYNAVVLVARDYLYQDRTKKSRFGETAAITAIKRCDPTFPQEVRKYLNHENPEIVMKCIRATRHFSDEKQCMELLEKFLAHPLKRVRACACLELGLSASRKSTSVFVRFLHDSDSRVRANTIELMETLNRAEFIPIIHKYRYDPNNRIRANAIRALNTLGQSDLIEDVRGMLLDRNALMRGSAVWLIGELGKADARYLKLCKMVLDDPVEVVQANLVVVLKKFGNVPQLRFLKKRLLKKRPHDFTPAQVARLRKGRFPLLWRWRKWEKLIRPLETDPKLLRASIDPATGEARQASPTPVTPAEKTPA